MSSNETIAMPGDPDGVGDKIAAAGKEAKDRRTRRGRDESPAPAQDFTMDGEPPATKEQQRGELTPAQHDGDGYGDLPAQMRPENQPKDEKDDQSK